LRLLGKSLCQRLNPLGISNMVLSLKSAVGSPISLARPESLIHSPVVFYIAPYLCNHP